MSAKGALKGGRAAFYTDAGHPGNVLRSGLLWRKLQASLAIALMSPSCAVYEDSRVASPKARHWTDMARSNSFKTGKRQTQSCCSMLVTPSKWLNAGSWSVSLPRIRSVVWVLHKPESTHTTYQPPYHNSPHTPYSYHIPRSVLRWLLLGEASDARVPRLRYLLFSVVCCSSDRIDAHAAEFPSQVPSQLPVAPAVSPASRRPRPGRSEGAAGLSAGLPRRKAARPVRVRIHAMKEIPGQGTGTSLCGEFVKHRLIRFSWSRIPACLDLALPYLTGARGLR